MQHNVAMGDGDSAAVRAPNHLAIGILLASHPKGLLCRLPCGVKRLKWYNRETAFWKISALACVGWNEECATSRREFSSRAPHIPHMEGLLKRWSLVSS